jgi:hypothetical protein
MIQEGAILTVYEGVPAELRPQTGRELLSSGMVAHLVKTAEMQPEYHDPSGKDPCYDAEAQYRIKRQRGRGREDQAP